VTDGILLCILIAASGGLMAWGLLKKDRFYQYPFLAGGVFVGWLLPQALPLRNDMALPEGAYASTLLMGILSVIALFLGATQAKPMRSFSWQFDQKRLLMVAAVLSAFGGVFYIMIGRLPEEILLPEDGRWTGLPTLYIFFANTLNYGFAIAVLIFVRTRSPVAFALCLWGLSFYAGLIILGGRRSAIIEFAMIMLLTLWFIRRWTPPRWAIALGFAAGTLLVWSIGDYREITGGQYGTENGRLPSWEELVQIDFAGNLDAVINNDGQPSELLTAVYDIAAAQSTSTYNLGAGYWNFFVFRFVPAQILGEDFKNGLMFTIDDPVADIYSYTSPVGLTHTGLADSFQAFWFFGALVFFFIGRIMGSVYAAAMRGSTVAQLSYALIAAQAMQAITHSTASFFTNWITLGLLLVLPISWARIHVAATVAGQTTFGHS
jgi:hypothetical protein